MKKEPYTQKQIHQMILIIGLLVFVWSYIGHRDTFGWASLITPIVVVSIFFIVTYEKFAFSTFVYFFGLIWIIILLIGAKYTYSQNPFFAWISEIFHVERNQFDRLGHFAQGFVPIMIFKEYLYRKNILKPSKMSNFLLIALVLSFSAFYELTEFAATIISNRPQSYILDLQGDMWDTQWDMILATIGAGVSLFTFGKMHNKIIIEMQNKQEIE